MYHAACKVEFQPFNRSYSQLTFSNFLLKKLKNVSCFFKNSELQNSWTSEVHCKQGQKKKRKTSKKYSFAFFHKQNRSISLFACRRKCALGRHNRTSSLVKNHHRQHRTIHHFSPAPPIPYRCRASRSQWGEAQIVCPHRATSPCWRLRAHFGQAIFG